MTFMRLLTRKTGLSVNLAEILPCPVIDTHAHIGHSDIPYSSSLQRNASPERLLALEDTAGVRYSVIVPVTYRNYRDGNAWIAAIAALFPDRFHPFARIDPSHSTAVSILEEAVDNLGLCGLKLALSPDKFNLRRLHDALELCSERNIPVLVCSACCFEDYIALAKKHSKTRFLFGHMGGGFNSKAACMYINFAKEVDNVWLEPSFMAMTSYLEKAAHEVPHRLMFGSDGPVNHPRVEIEKFLQLDVDKATLSRFLYKNAMEFLNIERLPRLIRRTKEISENRLVRDFRALGLCSGDIVIVHSSLSSIGYVEGGANTVVNSLIRSVSPGGTVLFPTNVFRGSVTEFMQTVRIVDLRKYPSQLGAISRAACLHPHSVRSLHPTHPVVGIGPDARNILSKHILAEGPCGKFSPYYEVAKRKGKILLLGVSSSCNTSLHTVEEISAPYIFSDERPFVISTFGMNGEKARVSVKPYVVGLARDFCQTEAPLLRKGILKLGRVGNAVTRLIDSANMMKWVTSQVKKDPEYLTLRISDC